MLLYILKGVTMQENKKQQDTHNPLEQQTTYHIEGRSFVVQPVFKRENANPIGIILLRLMQAEFEKNNELS